MQNFKQMAFPKLIVFVFLPILAFQISCKNSTDAHSNINDPTEEPMLTSPEPPANNRAELVATLPFPEAADTLVYDLWGYKSQNNSKNYILVGYALKMNDDYQHYMDIIDVSNPNSLSRVYTFQDMEFHDIKSWNNYIYTVTGVHRVNTDDGDQVVESGTIIDMQNPEQPQIVGSFPSAHNIFIDDRGYLYSTEDSFTIYDLKDTPTEPALIHERNGTYIHDIFVQDTTAYVFRGRINTKVGMYDVSDPANPILTKNIVASDINFSHSGWATSDNYLIVTDEFAEGEDADFSIWNMNPDSPELVYDDFADPNATAHNVMIQGNYAFFSYYSAGFRVFDVTDPEQPEYIGEVDTNPFEGESGEIDGNVRRFTLNGAFGIYALMDDGYYYLSDLTGLHVIQVDGIDKTINKLGKTRTEVFK